MSTLTKILVIVIAAGFLAIGPAGWEAAWADPTPVDVFPGKDSQIFRPETPGYAIKKNQDQVQEFMQVPAPPEKAEKKKEDKPQEQDQNKK